MFLGLGCEVFGSIAPFDINILLSHQHRDFWSKVYLFHILTFASLFESLDFVTL